jgi:glucose-1-phosphate thymidylyltransferase
MKALILAAGYATRLYPLTLNQPKALLPLTGTATVIDLIVDKLEVLTSISHIYIVTNHKYAAPFEAWAQGRASTKEIRIIDDGTTSVEDKLGAIGDMQHVVKSENIQDDLFVLAGDNVFTFELGPYLAYFYQMNRDCVLVKPTDDKEELRSIGVAELDEMNRVISLIEKPEEPRTNLGVYGLYIYKQSTLPLIQRYLEEGNSPDSPSHFPEWLVRHREVSAFYGEGDIYDIGTPAAYEEIRKRYLKE